MKQPTKTCSPSSMMIYGTSHKKVSRVTQYVTLLNDRLLVQYVQQYYLRTTFNVKRTTVQTLFFGCVQYVRTDSAMGRSTESSTDRSTDSTTDRGTVGT